MVLSLRNYIKVTILFARKKVSLYIKVKFESSGVMFIRLCCKNNGFLC